MVTLTVSVPDHVKQWIDEKVRTGEYDSSAAYFIELIERDRAFAVPEDLDTDELRRIVEEARASGNSTRTVDEIFDEAIERARVSGTLRD